MPLLLICIHTSCRQGANASKVQEVFDAVCRDGHAPAASGALGKLGTSGKFQGNVERDLHRYCSNNTLSCGITTYDVDTVVYDGSGKEVSS